MVLSRQAPRRVLEAAPVGRQREVPAWFQAYELLKGRFLCPYYFFSGLGPRAREGLQARTCSSLGHRETGRNPLTGIDLKNRLLSGSGLGIRAER